MGDVRRPMAANDRIVVFVCEGNRFRSQIAEAFFNAWAPAGWRGVSAGTNPKEAIHPGAVELMMEMGIDISSQRPKPLDPIVMEGAWRVLAMCAPESCPVTVAHKTERWAIADPADVPEPRWHEIRDEIAERVKGLIRDIARAKG